MGNILFRFFPSLFTRLDEENSDDESYNGDVVFNEDPVDKEPVEEKPVEEEPVLNKTYFSSAKKKALLIGINYNEDNYKDDDLNGCVNDLNNLKEFLKKLDFKKEEIVTLTNREATKERIQDEILNLSSFSHENPGSNIWLSYSGHGAQIETLFNS